MNFNFLNKSDKKEKQEKNISDNSETPKLKGYISKTEYIDEDKENKKEKNKYEYSENKFYQPKHDTYRNIAIDSYSKTGNKIENYKPSYESENKNTGFSARAYIDEDNKTIVIAYQGTNIGSGKDWSKNNLPMSVANKIPEQFQDAEKFYKKIKDELGENAKNYNIVFTGHSLGGTLSELMGAKYGNETVTFNAYGANQLKDAEINHRSNIINYGHIKDKVFNAPFSSHVGNVISTDETKPSYWPFKNHHKAENMGDLSKSVFKSKGR